MSDRKGIILAGGTGSRLFPITHGVSKQLLPIYDKPMVYYPLTALMLAGLREIAVITTPQDADQFRRLLGDGRQWGVVLSYIEQPEPEGLAQAYLLARDFLGGAASAMVLGDNLFFGHGLTELLQAATGRSDGSVFGYQVTDPERYGVVGFDGAGKVTSITEKPAAPASDFAVTGMYFLPGDAPDRASSLSPSSRGELEIADLLTEYLRDGQLRVELMGRGFAWLDTGTHASLLDAGNFVRTLQDRQGLQIGVPEEVALLQGWIGPEDVTQAAARHGKTAYGRYLETLAKRHG